MQTIIEIKNLRKIYKDNKVALDDVNLNILKGSLPIKMQNQILYINGYLIKTL